MKNGILDLIVDELNKQHEKDGRFERLHSEQYQIVTTENGVFYNPVKSNNQGVK